VFITANTTVLTIAIAGLILYGLARASADANTMPVLCLVADPRYRATGYGVLNLLSCLVGGAGIYAGGSLRDAAVNVNTLFVGAGVSMLVCAAILFMIKLPHRLPEE
jgi:hypothetical protein